MTLPEITKKISNIQQLASVDAQLAVEENTKLFIAMVQQDGAYLVLGQDACPITAPVQEGDPRLFLRVFSHAEAAAAFAEKESGREVRPIDGVELMQLAKAYFLYGVYGLLLNDGLAWAALSFPDFLTACFVTILGDESMADEEFIATVRLVNMVRQNEFYRIASEDTPDGGVSLFAQGTEGDILDVQKLLALEALPKNAGVHIKIEDIDCTITADLLQGAFRVTALADSRVPWPDYQTDFLNLDFRSEDFIQKSDVSPEEAPVEAESSAPGVEETPQKGKPLKKKEKSPKKKREKSGKRGGKLVYAAGGLAVVILIVFAFTIYGYFSTPSPLESLQNDISTQYYASVGKHYAECKGEGTAAEALQLMNDDLSERLRSYANSECEAQELKDVIDVYVSIPDMEEAAENAFAKGAIIEKSRAAYQAGLAETSVSRKLEFWRDVSAEDVTSYATMQTYLSENAAGNKYIVFQEADSLGQSEAMAKLLLLQSFYPNDADISAKIRLIRNGNASAVQPSGGIPADGDDPATAATYISISRASVHSGGWDGEVSLYIDWSNISGKEIEEVAFEVIPYDEFGEQAYTKIADDNGQYYSRYLARDVGPFAAGYETPSQHEWKNAWVNSLISSVTIDKVSIFFVGEEAPVVITDAETITAMFEQKG